MTNLDAVVFFTGLAETDPTGTAKLPGKAKSEPGVCWCGCGGLTKGRFVPGHDARFHSLARRAMRGEIDQDEALESLAHDEAREHFVEYQDKIRPSEVARAKVEAAKAAAKAAVAEAKAAAKVATEPVAA